MADTFARMRQLIGSTAEWAANNIVLGFGEIGIERVSALEYRAKVGDGSTKWSLLPYLSTVTTSINSAIQAALDAKLPLAGGTMTGDLILAHDGTRANEAVTLSQLQNEVSKLSTSLSKKVGVGGDTMTGPLLLSRDAQATKEAVTLDQMNKAIAALSFVASGSLQFGGTVDMTAAFAMPSPPPVNGEFYTVTKTGPVEATWNPHLANTGLVNVSLADYIVWNATTSKFHHVSNAMSSGSGAGSFVPLAGTNQMSGEIAWAGAAGNQAGRAIISGKGGSINDAVIDSGTY